MNYIVFDLEWNQAAEGKVKENKEIPFEIIEIGAIKLNSGFNSLGEFSELIKPKVYRNMHHVTKSLIHLKMEELEQGGSFEEVMQRFLDWCGDDYLFCTWGPLDLTELQRNMRYYKFAPLAEGPIKFLDIQKLFSFQFEDKKSRRTLEYAIDFLKIEKDISFHRAFSDAYYTVKVLTRLQAETLKHYSLDVYNLPCDKAHEVFVTFSDYSKYISREFEDKTVALSDKEVICTRCYLCNKALKKKIKWFTPNGKHYYSVSYCNEHGYLKGKIRIRKAENSGIYVIKTLKLIPEEEIEEIRFKQERARVSRQIKRKAKRK